MKLELRLSRWCEKDIEGVLDHTLERFGPAKCDEYRELIQKALEEIAAKAQSAGNTSHPGLPADWRTFHIARPGRRARHLFVFRVLNEKVIGVSRLLHDSMEIPRHIPRDY